MEWQQFEYFQTLAKMEHVTRAAEALSITQPALSRSIARFEEEIGVPLFERTGRSIRLNQYGRKMLAHVDTMLDEFRAAKEEIQDMLEPGQGTVSLGFIHSISTNHVPDLLAAFRKQFPKVQFQLSQGPSHHILARLKDGTCDLALIAPMDVEPPARWHELWSEELFLIVPKNHPLANETSVLLDRIAHEPIIHLKPGYSLRITVERLFEEAGITPNITFEGDEADTVAGLVSAGLGISILPHQHGIDESNIVQLPIRHPKPQRTVGIAYIDGRYQSPATKQFHHFVINYFNKR